MDPFGEKLEHLKARYAGEPSMPPHVVLDLLASLHAEVHQVSLDLSVALDGVTRLDDNVTLKDLIDKDHRVRARIYHRGVCPFIPMSG